MFITDKEKLRKYTTEHRIWQGIPSIEVTKNGIKMAKVVTFGEIMLRLQTYRHQRIIQATGFDANFVGGSGRVQR